MNGKINEFMDEWMNEWMNKWMNQRKNKCIDGQIKEVIKWMDDRSESNQIKMSTFIVSVLW